MPGTVGGRGLLRTAGQHGAEQGPRGIGDGDEVPGQAVGGVVRGGGGEDAGVIAECGEQRFRFAHGTGLGVEAEVGGVAQEGPGAGVGVPDAEEGVVLPLDEMVAGDPGPVVGGGVLPPSTCTVRIGKADV